MLAIPRWKLLVAWMVLDSLVWFPRMAYYLELALVSAHLDDRGLPQGWFPRMVINPGSGRAGTVRADRADIYRAVQGRGADGRRRRSGRRIPGRCAGQVRAPTYWMEAARPDRVT